MTLIQATASGLPFVRKSWNLNHAYNPRWIIKDLKNNYLRFEDSFEFYHPTEKDILSDDWLVKEPNRYLWAYKPADEWLISSHIHSDQEMEELGYIIGQDAIKLEEIE